MESSNVAKLSCCQKYFERKTPYERRKAEINKNENHTINRTTIEISNDMSTDDRMTQVKKEIIHNQNV